jgi:hypothetical protein
MMKLTLEPQKFKRRANPYLYPLWNALIVASVPTMRVLCGVYTYIYIYTFFCHIHTGEASRG